VGLRHGLDAVEKRKSCPCRESNPGRPTCSPSLYRLRYPDSFNCFIYLKNRRCQQEMGKDETISKSETINLRPIFKLPGAFELQMVTFVPLYSVCVCVCVCIYMCARSFVFV
jgi:hypothetical protein